jgi:hypothetical protein
MENSGHKTVSQYVRSLILEQDLSSQKMLRELYKKMVLEADKNGANNH